MPHASSPGPRVSVVLCVIDPHPRYFPEAVRSILAQTLSDLELIIVEEPSSARAAPLLAALSDPRIRHVEHPVRTSLVEQRNRGLALARSELVASMDADDIALPDRLALQCAYLDSHPEVAVLGGQLELIDPDGALLGQRHYPCSPAEISRAMRVANPLGNPSVMVRRSVVRGAGGYQHPLLEDYELWIRLDKAGVQMANLAVPVLRYRLHPGATKATKLRASLDATIALKERYYAGELGLQGRLRLAAERGLRLLPPALIMRLFVLLTARGRRDASAHGPR